jgi:hypothetical protein
MVVQYISIADQAADGLTKALGKIKHKRFMEFIDSWKEKELESVK